VHHREGGAVTVRAGTAPCEICAYTRRSELRSELRFIVAASNRTIRATQPSSKQREYS
jgi:hypothetical protein